MAGLSGKQVIVDVIALAESVSASAMPELPTEPPVSLESGAVTPSGVGSSCPFGHANTAAAVFCASCGVKMDAQVGKPDLEAARPVPADQLDAAAKAERARQHAAAVTAAASFEQAPERIVPNTGQGVLIHFIEDGLTVFGRVWYRGQELEIGPDHPRWPDAVGWIMLDRIGQHNRWGRQYFEHGPWPGARDYRAAAGQFEQLATVGGEGTFAGPSDEQLAQANRAEAMRGRGVPVSTFR